MPESALEKIGAEMQTDDCEMMKDHSAVAERQCAGLAVKITRKDERNRGESENTAPARSSGMTSGARIAEGRAHSIERSVTSIKQPEKHTMDSSLMNVADSDDRVGLQTPTQEGVLTCVLRRLDKQLSRPSGMPNIADLSNCGEREPPSPSIASAVTLTVVPQRHVLGCPVLCGAPVPLRPLLAEVHGQNDTELVVMSDDVASQRGHLPPRQNASHQLPPTTTALASEAPQGHLGPLFAVGANRCSCGSANGEESLLMDIQCLQRTLVDSHEQRQMLADTLEQRSIELAAEHDDLATCQLIKKNSAMRRYTCGVC